MNASENPLPRARIKAACASALVAKGPAYTTCKPLPVLLFEAGKPRAASRADDPTEFDGSPKAPT